MSRHLSLGVSYSDVIGWHVVNLRNGRRDSLPGTTGSGKRSAVQHMRAMYETAGQPVHTEAVSQYGR